MAVTTWKGETTHVGLVLAKGEHNYYDDSDFYALVWDPETKAPKEVEYATTRGAGGGSAVVGATPEVLAAYEAYKAARAAAARKAREETEARTPAKGKTLKVVKGRKVPVGTVGECVWYGKGKSYGHGAPPMRVGLKKANGEVVWTDAKNVEVVAHEAA